MRVPLFILLIVMFIFIAGCTQNGEEDGNEDKDSQYPGCCTPFCKGTNEQECSALGGSYIYGSCSAVPECKKGCCIPTCDETTSSYCSQAGGEWREGSCEAQQECKKVCCKPFNTETTVAYCEQTGGTPENLPCNGDSADLTIEITDATNCDCSNEIAGSNLAASCTKANSIVERISFYANRESLESSDDEYTLTGKAIYELDGNADYSKTMSAETFCAKNSPPKSTITSMEESRRVFNKRIEDKGTIYIYKEGNEYIFSFSLDAIPEVISEKSFKRSTSNDCPGTAMPPAQDERAEELYDGLSSVEFKSEKFSGSEKIEYYQQFGFYCEGQKRPETRVKWSLDWIKDS